MNGNAFVGRPIPCRFDKRAHQAAAAWLLPPKLPLGLARGRHGGRRGTNHEQRAREIARSTRPELPRNLASSPPIECERGCRDRGLILLFLGVSAVRRTQARRCRLLFPGVPRQMKSRFLLSWVMHGPPRLVGDAVELRPSLCLPLPLTGDLILPRTPKI